MNEPEPPKPMNTEEESLQPGYYVMMAIILVSLIISAGIAAGIRYIFYSFIDRNFSITDEPTKLCVVLTFLSWAILFVCWIGKIKKDQAHNTQQSTETPKRR